VISWLSIERSLIRPAISQETLASKTNIPLDPIIVRNTSRNLWLLITIALGKDLPAEAVKLGVASRISFAPLPLIKIVQYSLGQI
jgi:hypothetical protein